jgi:hypothetical protein
MWCKNILKGPKGLLLLTIFIARNAGIISRYNNAAKVHKMNLSNVINEAVSYIHSSETVKKDAASALLNLRDENLSTIGSKELHEEKLLYNVKKAPLDFSVGGVDSGFVDKKLPSLDLVLVRSVGVLFVYEKNLIKDAKYLPGYYQFPLPHLTNHSLELDEFNCSKSLIRLKEEVNSAKQLIKSYKPKYLFLDGSIIPQYQDKPRQDSSINDLYHSIIREFQELYEEAEKNNVVLIGCVEDSRGSRFRSILQEEVLPNKKVIAPEKLDFMFDSGLLDHLLAVGERTFSFSYTKNISQHPILNDFDKKWSESIYSFYLKPAHYDRPLRVEFIKSGKLSEQVDEISSVVYALSCLHREYAYPSILIEADLRARLKPEEIDIVYNKILDKIGKNIRMKLRRDSRPF